MIECHNCNCPYHEIEVPFCKRDECIPKGTMTEFLLIGEELKRR